MTVDDNIRDEKLQYDINREAAKIWVLSSRKIADNQRQIIEQARFPYYTLEKLLKNKQRNRFVL